MKYIELTVHTATEGSELVADAMWAYSPYGVTVCDAADAAALAKDSTVFWDYMDENVSSENRDVLVKCYLEPSEAEEKIRLILGEIASRKERSEGAIDFGSLEETKREIEGDDWIDVWKKHFRPIHLGRIVVVPEWIDYKKEAGEEIVYLDSNMAFGTGEHETTSMCVELLQKYLKEGDTVLDVGCGSGILGISAAKLGAKRCYLSDLDPIAVESAEHNCALNNVEDITRVTLSDLLTDSSVEADVILANITAEILCLLAPSVPSHLRSGRHAHLERHHREQALPRQRKVLYPSALHARKRGKRASGSRSSFRGRLEWLPPSAFLSRISGRKSCSRAKSSATPLRCSA